MKRKVMEWTKRNVSACLICITEETIQACKRHGGEYFYITEEQFEGLNGQIDICRGKPGRRFGTVYLIHKGLHLPARDVKCIDSWEEECRD